MHETTSTRPEIPVACSLTPEEKDQRGDELTSLFSSAQETIEIPRGYALRYSADESLTAMLVQAIIKERECCPFFEFKLVFEPGNGPLWFYIEGSEGTKDLISLSLPSVSNA